MKVKTTMSKYNAILSDQTLDQDHDRILSWNLKDNQKVPLLYQHQQDQLPVGYVEVSSENSQLKGVIETYDNEAGQTVDTSLKNGSLNGLSVGFATDSFVPNSFDGWDYSNATLHEVSVVLNPANLNAHVIVEDLEAQKSQGGKKPVIKGVAYLDITKAEDVPNSDDTKEAEDVPADEKAKSENVPAIDKAEKDGIMKDKEASKPNIKNKFFNAEKQEGHQKMAEITKTQRNALLEKSIKAMGPQQVLRFGDVWAYAKENVDVAKSLGIPDSDSFAAQPAPTISDNQYEDGSVLAAMDAPIPYSSLGDVYTVDLTTDEAQAIAHVTGLKDTQVVQFVKRDVHSGSILALQEIEYKTLVEDEDGQVLGWVIDELGRQVRAGLTKQILIGNPKLEAKDVNIDSKIVPVAKDDAAHTTQATWVAPTVKGLAENLNSIKGVSDGLLVVINRKTKTALSFETSAQDGHFILGSPATTQSLGDLVGGQIVINDDLADGEVVAFDKHSYKLASKNINGQYLEDYKLDNNTKQVERVVLASGALTKPQSGLHIVQAAAPAGSGN